MVSVCVRTFSFFFSVRSSFCCRFANSTADFHFDPIDPRRGWGRGSTSLTLCDLFWGGPWFVSLRGLSTVIGGFFFAP